MEFIKDIPIGDEVTFIKEITKGMSGERKYYLETRGDKKYLLRVTDSDNYEIKQKDYNFLVQLNKADLPVPIAVA